MNFFFPKTKTTASTNNLDQYTPFIPVFGAFLMFYGYINLVTFYKAFNIEIIHFINLSELILYFLKDIYTILFILIVYVVTQRVSTALQEKKPAPEKPTNTKTKKIVNIVSWVFIFASSMVLIWLVDATYWMYPIVPIAFWAVLKWTITDARLTTLLTVLSFGLFYSYFIATIEAEKVIKGKNIGFTVVLHDEVLPSDSTHYVIGITENYIFYHNATENVTQAIPVDQVKQIGIRGK